MANQAQVLARSTPGSAGILCTGDIERSELDALLSRYGVTLVPVAGGELIPGSFWGAPEAGIIGMSVYARADTPLHSMLHELGHIVCMTRQRRMALERDAGGDDAEECAVCYLQLILAAHLPGVGQARLMRDMDAWGYSFRLGSTRRWFERDASDARDWLLARGLITEVGSSTWQLRQD